MRSTDETFLEVLRTYLEPFRVNGEQERPPGVLFSAYCGTDRELPGGRLVRGKRQLFFSYLRIYNGRHDDEMAARLIGFAREAATQLSNEFVRFRAAAVATESGALMLPSPPEPRLPTLAALMVRSGARYLGDEMVNVDPILHRLHGLRLPLLLPSADLELFPELYRERGRRRLDEPLDETVRAVTPRRVVSPEELGSAAAEPTPLGWIVFPVFEEGAETRLEPYGGAEAIFAFTQAVLNLHVWEDRTLALLKDLLESMPVSRLIIGSVEEAAGLLLETAPTMLSEGVNP